MNKVILAEFFAKWCGACMAQAPILEELEKKFGHNVEFIKINIDDNRDMVRELNINATPTLFIFKNDDVFRKYIGLTNISELESSIAGALTALT